MKIQLRMAGARLLFCRVMFALGCSPRGFVTQEGKVACGGYGFRRVLTLRHHGYTSGDRVERHPVSRFLFFPAVTLSTAALLSGIAFGQAVSQISGTVRDSTGAVVPDVQVTATQTDTGVKRTATTDAAGYYILPNLPLGPYRLEAGKMGFQNYVQTGIVLQVGTAPEVAITLTVGQVTQAVEVQANVTQVETRSVGVGSVVENQRIIDLPLNGRDPTQLITLSGAAVQGTAGPSFQMRTGYQFAVAGGYATGVQYNWDGANYVDQFSGIGMLLPFPDALQEFKLSTSAQDASNVGQGAATINAVTRSGTNAFHGNLFEFFRNYDVNARDFFASGPDGLKRNQFGGTLGGPLIKDKLFFFVGYQGTLVRQTPLGAQEFVPTAAELMGDFRDWASPTCQGGKQLTLRGGFVNNMISPSSFSPAAVKIAQRLPAGTGPCGVFTNSYPLHENDLQAPVRVDYQLSSKQTLFARSMIARQDAVVPYTLEPNNVLAADGVGNDDQETTFTLGDTYVISPSVVNSTRLFFNRIAANFPGAKMFGPQDVGIKMYTYQPNYLPIRVVGAFNLGAGQFSQDSFAYTTSFGANEDFTISHGSHLFAFGGYFTHTNEWTVAQAWSAGSFTFAPALTGNGLSDFFLGFMAQFRQANPNPVNARQNSMALYAQDTWKLTPKLTLNYGIVWDPFFGMSFPQKDSYTFNLGNFYKGIRSTVIPNAPPGFLYPGDHGFNGTSPINPKYSYINPRVGLAWDPFGDGKTAIRVGGGISHDIVPLELQLNTESSSPFRLTVIPTGIFDGLDNPFPGGDPFPYNYNKSNPFFAPYGSYLPIPANLQAHVLYSWNLGVQRQITPNWFLSATYIGHHYIHTWDSVELNPAQYIPGNCAAGQYGLTAPGPCTSASNIDQRRVLNVNVPGTQLGYLTMYDDAGTQSCNGFLLTSTWRLRTNVTLNANYTWSHCIGLPDIGTVLNPGQKLSPPRLWAEYGARRPRPGIRQLRIRPAARCERHSGFNNPAVQQRLHRQLGLQLDFLEHLHR
jgi:Carboxypeptidase regulatory-like domain